MFCDLALLTFIMVAPNPLSGEIWPTAFQYQLGEFGYFYVFLAAATLAYSWRTLFAFGAWTTGLWLGALILVAMFGSENPELSEKVAVAFAGYERIRATVDPNDPQLPLRIQEVVVFLIVVGILAVNGRRNNQLIFRQADVARERANLARHFPPNIVDQMAERDEPLGAVRSQEVAAMFVDIVGFTRMAEQQTPEEVVALLRQFHARLEAAVFEHQGTLDKFLGDGLMATFGTPDPGPHDALNALGCGRAMLADIGSWNHERKEVGAEPIQISIGIHYGPVVLGDIGSERRLEYAVLGDTVNVASRLEALTRNLGVSMVVSDDLVTAVRHGADAEVKAALSELDSLGLQRLRGRDEPINVWTI
jgi:adenylate cyclase